MTLFIAGDVCLSKNSIHKVILLESGFSFIKGHDAIPARVVINDNYLFAGRDGMEALKALHDCDYLAYPEYDHLKSRYQKLLNTYELASEGKMPAETTD